MTLMTVKHNEDKKYRGQSGVKGDESKSGPGHTISFGRKKMPIIIQ